jgi:aspartyl aminopeptidase
MDEQQLIADFLEFIKASPTPFHAVSNMRALLQQAGYEVLHENERWKPVPGGRYLVTRNDSSMIAFHLEQADIAHSGIQMVGAHTDSPCLKVKPKPGLIRHKYYQLGVEVYGGALLNPWFDRDLCMAGRVYFRNTKGAVENALINFHEPIAMLPSLAIHLDREVNSSRSINNQQHLPPLLLLDGAESVTFTDILLQQLSRQFPKRKASEIVSHELYLYDSQAPALLGLNHEFIAAARLDNLLSCFAGMQSLIHQQGKTNSLLICTDHEEVGSGSFCGADGNFLHNVLQRLCLNAEDFGRCMQRSMLVSADNAHGIHPNYLDRHDDKHGPLLNAGPVIKVNSNQRYASNSTSIARFSDVCQRAQIPVQHYVVRSDLACGSTIGPITASQIGVNTVDVGVASLAMHSIRELAGCRDLFFLFNALKEFFADENI